MLQFIRLTSRVINKAHIIEITKPCIDKYSIHMSIYNITPTKKKNETNAIQ